MCSVFLHMLHTEPLIIGRDKSVSICDHIQHQLHTVKQLRTRIYCQLTPVKAEGLGSKLQNVFLLMFFK